MIGDPLVIVDRDRAAQFALLGSVVRLFQDFQIWSDAEGITWAGKRLGNFGFGVTWLGSGWVFDPVAAERWADRLASQRQMMEEATTKRHHRELDHDLELIQLGRLTERLLWVIHQSVVTLGSSVIRLPDHLLRTAVWGERDWPQHWRTDLLRLLQGLSWLHLGKWHDDERPLFGQDTALFTHVADLRGNATDVCGPGCLGRLGPRHHHFLVNIGRGFLAAR